MQQPKLFIMKISCETHQNSGSNIETFKLTARVVLNPQQAPVLLTATEKILDAHACSAPVASNTNEDPIYYSKSDRGVRYINCGQYKKNGNDVRGLRLVTFEDEIQIGILRACNERASPKSPFTSKSSGLPDSPKNISTFGILVQFKAT